MQNNWSLITCLKINFTYKLFTYKSCILKQDLTFVWFGLVWFYSKSTSTDYLMTKPFLYISPSSSCHAALMDLPEPLLPPISITHLSWEVLQATSYIGTELLCISSGWFSCFCSSMWRGAQEYIAYEFVLTSPAVSRMSASSDSDSFHDWW